MRRGVAYIVFVLIFCAGLYSCSGLDVNFSESQPAGVNEVSKFKYKFRGTYLSLEDSSILEVSKSSIIQYWMVELDIDADSVKSNGSSVKKIHIDTDDGDFNFTPSEDSAHVKIDYTHDVFKVSESDVLKYVDGIYYLNYQYSDLAWDLKTMRVTENGNLVIQDFHLSQSNLEDLKAYTEVLEIGTIEGEITGYYIQPTHTELEQLMGSDIFSKGEEFVRIRNN